MLCSISYLYYHKVYKTIKACINLDIKSIHNFDNTLAFIDCKSVGIHDKYCPFNVKNFISLLSRQSSQ